MRLTLTVSDDFTDEGVLYVLRNLWMHTVTVYTIDGGSTTGSVDVTVATDHEVPIAVFDPENRRVCVDTVLVPLDDISRIDICPR